MAQADNFHLVYNETRTSPILNEAEKYELAIIRYSVPIHLLPLFIYDPTKYQMGFLVNGATNMFDLNDFVNPENMYTDIRKNYVMNIQTWIDYINRKIILNTGDFVRLCIQNGRLVIIVPIPQYVTTPINAATSFLLLNEAMYTQFFCGFPALKRTDGLYQLNITYKPNQYYPANTFMNDDGETFYGGETFGFIDSFNSLASWNLIRRIVLLTSNIQIVNETLSTKVYTDSSSTTNNAGTLQMITDHEIPYGSNALDKNYLFYHPHS